MIIKPPTPWKGDLIYLYQFIKLSTPPLGLSFIDKMELASFYISAGNKNAAGWSSLRQQDNTKPRFLLIFIPGIHWLAYRTIRLRSTIEMVALYLICNSTIANLCHTPTLTHTSFGCRSPFWVPCTPQRVTTFSEGEGILLSHCLTITTELICDHFLVISNPA